MNEPRTLARIEHDKHIGFVDGCPYCIRRLEDAQEDNRQQVADFCLVHGEVGCKEPSCFRCGNHQLSDGGVCSDPRCGASTRVLFSRLWGDHEALLPTRAYAGDAGLDLYASIETRIPARAFLDVPIGLAMALPDGYFARVTGRSSAFRRRGILVIEGIIDAGYRGPLFAGCWNTNQEDILVSKHERLAQIIIHRVERLDPHEQQDLPQTARGTRGFGSSGQ